LAIARSRGDYVVFIDDDPGKRAQRIM